MRKITGVALLLLIMTSFGKTVEKKVDKNKDQTGLKTEESGVPLPIGDYSSLLLNYEGDMTTADVAIELFTRETDLQ